MSVTNLRIWNRNKVRHLERQESNTASNVIPMELRASLISHYRVTNDNDRNRDLFWVMIIKIIWILSIIELMVAIEINYLVS